MNRPALVRTLRHLGFGLLLPVLGVLRCTPALAQEIGGLVSPGPLSKAHSNLEGLQNCDKCHEPGHKVTAERCLSCHKPIAERMAAHQGVHRNVTSDCVSCHVEHAGRDARTSPLEVKKFDHAAETRFRLDGKHAVLARDCAKCHTTHSFLGLKADCASCHKDPHQGVLGVNCTSCHPTSVAFKETAAHFDHDKTQFRLTGGHARVACEKCHANKVWKLARFAACLDCHHDPHHEAFGANCTSCHGNDNWNTQKVDHARTRYALVGKHATTACVACHVHPAMKAKLEFDRCASCHTDPHQGEFKQDCAACHTPASFQGAPFDHLAKTGFALTGRHATLPCSSCHKGAATTKGKTSLLVPSHRPAPREVAGFERASFEMAGVQVTTRAPSEPRGERQAVDFRGLSKDCASCHTDPHAGKLGTACESCHGSETWRISSFKHPKNAEFYGGQHATVACEKCHGGEGVSKVGLTGKAVAERVFRGLSSECASCHKDVHLGQLGSNCQSCHSVDAAKFAADRFSHAKTTFLLTGKHEKVECAKCHARESAVFPSGAGEAVHFKGIGTACASCHKDAHLGQLGTQCEGCHTTTNFLVQTYKHKKDPELFVAKHASAECQACHKRVESDFPAGHGTAVRYAALTSVCATCHEDVHHGTLGDRCETCHTPVRWQNASRAFHKATLFPLEGMHLEVPCESCHQKGVLKGTPIRCYDCHWIRRQDDRFRTRLGIDCENCHRAISWTAVTWDHATATGFPLNAAHQTVACESCHQGGTFGAGTSVDCFGCHAQAFRTATNPNHVQAGFPTNCELCHKASDATWLVATFNHSSFYPLLGVHATQQCNACHGDGVYKGKSTACVSCHLTQFNSSANPNHVKAGFAQT
ncbi:MAG: hypothetical protein ACHQHM_04305, partial [Thermoanaerobaculales bacterium]